MRRNQAKPREPKTLFALYALVGVGVFTEILACVVILYMQMRFISHFDLAKTNTALVVFLLCTTANIFADILSLRNTWQY